MSFLFFLPILQGLELLKKPYIAGVAAGLEFPCPQGLQHSATLFLRVAAPHKAAGAKIRRELPEGLRQAVLQLQVQLIRFKGGKARGIHDVPAAGEMVQLHMAGGMAAPAQCVTDLAHLQVKRRVQRV